MENKFENCITIIKSRIEYVDLPVSKVDIIISEWMGYWLLYECMLDSIIFAKNKWLRRDGLMFPDKATLFISGMEDEEYRASKIDFWDDVYGISMRSIKEVALREPLIDLIDPDWLVTNIWPVY